MPWLVLVLAGLMETVWATALSRITGPRDWQPITVWVLGMALSMTGLGYALKYLPMGTAYAVWVGIGAVGTVVWGMAFQGEPINWPRVLCLTLIVGGVVGLRLTSS